MLNPMIKRFNTLAWHTFKHYNVLQQWSPTYSLLSPFEYIVFKPSQVWLADQIYKDHDMYKDH